MPESNSINLNSILGKNKSSIGIYQTLEDGSQLYLDEDVPYLLICRNATPDSALGSLVKGGASFFIIKENDKDYYSNFLLELASEMSTKFRSYLLIELFESNDSTNEFTISGPSEKLPATLEILKQELEKIDSNDFYNCLTARIESSKERHQKNQKNIVAIEAIKNAGATLLSIEIPTVFYSFNHTVFPIYFRKFRNQFIHALQQGIFEFIRVQTNSSMISYKALGKRKIHQELLNIDKEITEIQSSYQFLLLVAPVNIQQIKKQFFESNYKDVLDYHYRLLPVDPDLLKRKLYDLKIDEIDDPAMAYLYNEKREEIEHELTMLKERGTKNFFYSSVRLYGAVELELLNEAKEILTSIKEDTEEQQDCDIDAEEFKSIAEKEFEYFRKQDPNFGCKVHIREDVNIIMVSRGELYLPTDYKMTEMDANALIQHEIGTHVLTYFNGKNQPLSQLAIGLADYDPLQEGIAVLSEYLTGALSGNRLRTLAGRVIAGAALFDGKNFIELFKILMNEYGFTDERAFNITSRMFQGGGFLKDIIYLKGLYQLKKQLKNKDDLKRLLSGKFALKHINIIQELTERGLLNPPKIYPRYLEDKKTDERLKKFINEPSLSKMIEK